MRNNASDDTEIAKAKIFALGLVISFLMTVVLIISNSPPIILGTELNTNGLVEYLCLGNGCEDLHKMDW